MSDAKYKSLMRLVDVAIPNFDGGSPEPASRPNLKVEIPQTSRPSNFPLSAGLFGPKDTAYTIDEEDDEETVDTGEEQFFEADQGGSSEVS